MDPSLSKSTAPVTRLILFPATGTLWGGLIQGSASIGIQMRANAEIFSNYAVFMHGTRVKVPLREQGPTLVHAPPDLTIASKSTGQENVVSSLVLA